MEIFFLGFLGRIGKEKTEKKRRKEEEMKGYLRDATV